MTNHHRLNSPKRPWATLVAVAVGGVMVGLDGTALAIAGPNIARDIGASLGELQWIANAYLVTLAVGLLPAGRLADRVGRRKIFFVGVAGFGLMSLGIAFSSSVAALVVLRALQGVSGALLQPAALALLRAAFPKERLDLALGVWGAVNAAAIAGGPLVGGVVVQGFGWPAVFLLNAPLAVLSLGLAWWTVAESRSEAGQRGGLRALFRFPAVRVGTVLIGLSFFAIFGLLFFLTLYLQNVRGLDPIGAGGWLLPLTAVVVLSAPLGGVLTGRFGPRWPAAGGMLVLAVGLFGLSRLSADTGLADYVPSALLCGLGAGVALVAGTEAIVGTAPTTMAGLASAVQQVATQLGGVCGIAVLSGVMSWRVADVLPERLRDFAVPDVLGGPTMGAASSIAQGTVPIPPGTATAVASQVVEAGHSAFLSGLTACLLVAAATIMLAGLIAATLPPSRRPAASVATSQGSHQPAS
ncbi:MFS transporter [Longimycelium tulufanense]|uniref:MFS transporter n=1 Tax=Longimycelium tulufanense TaxID=907463 RepID=A0A8J3FW47_9PSEU|nr:MFS transporter [Longimycelium tulufanense]GGM56705.1 MFS transporter [Longimycelium tulufanense]